MYLGCHDLGGSVEASTQNCLGAGRLSLLAITTLYHGSRNVHYIGSKVDKLVVYSFIFIH
jgi:hypothetical protein